MTTWIQSFKEPLLRFVRSAGVGIAASGADFASLFLLVHGLHILPVAANAPSLLVGVVVQFVGARFVVFRKSKTPFKQQLFGFCVTELGTLTLNALVFHALVSFTPIPYMVARLLGSFLVFVGFSFPMWTRVFAPARTGV